VLAGKSYDSYFVRHFTIEADGSETFRNSSNVPAFLLEEKFISNIAAFCNNKKGAFENIRVGTGNFQACKTRWENSDFVVEEWWAQEIPFGIVKRIDFKKYAPNEVAETQLLSFGKQ
jgi:hypothetical protein